MHAAGNDYIYVDGDKNKNADFPATAKTACDRRFGIGADGIIAVYDDSARGGDLFMRIFNADGSEGSTCGNGLRCSAVFAKMTGKTDKTEIKIRTLSATHNVSFRKYGDKIISTADFPMPEFAATDAVTETALKSVLNDREPENPHKTPKPFKTPGNLSGNVNVPETDISRETKLSDRTRADRSDRSDRADRDGHPGYFDEPAGIARIVNNGNLHAVFFGAKKTAETISAELLSAGVFPDGINVESAAVFEDVITCDVCERGSGTTYSCGSGAIATAFAAKNTLGLKLDKYPVMMRGGTLFVEFDGNVARLSGEVTPVYRGTYFGGEFLRDDKNRDKKDFKENLRKDSTEDI